MCCKAPDQRAHDGATDGCDSPDADGIGPVLRCKHITQASSTGGKYGTSDESRNEAECEQHAKVDGQRSWYLQNDEDDQSPDVDGIAANLRYFTHGCPDHWTKPVTGHKKRQAEGSCDLRDAEDHSDIFGASAVNGGADIYGESQEANLKCDEDLLEC